MAYDATSGKLAGMTRTDTNYGEYFTIRGLPAGSYKVAINPGEAGFARQWYPNSPDAAGAEQVTVASGGTTGGIDVILAVGGSSGSISGTVTGNSAVTVLLYDWDTEWVIAHTAVAADGSYRFDGLQDGSYSLRVMAGHSDTWYRAAGEDGQASQIVVNSGSAVIGIDFQLTDGSAAACGSTDGATMTSAPTSGLCAAGIHSAVNGNGPWTWSCSGTDSGVTVSCAAVPPRSGVLVPAPGKTGPDIGDAVRVLNIAYGRIAPTAADLVQGDLAPLDSSGKPLGDNVIDTYDVIGMLRKVAGLL